MPSPIAQVRNETPRLTPKSFEITTAIGNIFDAIGAGFSGESKDIASNGWLDNKAAIFSQNAALVSAPASVEEALEKHKNLDGNNQPELRLAFKEILDAQVAELHRGSATSAEAVGVLIRIGEKLGGEGQILVQIAYEQIEEARRDPGQNQTRGKEHLIG